MTVTRVTTFLYWLDYALCRGNRGVLCKITHIIIHAVIIHAVATISFTVETRNYTPCD